MSVRSTTTYRARFGIEDADGEVPAITGTSSYAGERGNRSGADMPVHLVHRYRDSMVRGSGASKWTPGRRILRFARGIS